jgi:RNA polymerase sigma-70 factor, ECF subfamily
MVAGSPAFIQRDTEAALVRRARGGAGDAFAELYTRHFRAVYRVAFLICRDAGTAEDIAQETFLAAIRNLDRFDRSRPLRPWLAQIASNRAVDWLRARARRPEESAVEASAAAHVGDARDLAAVIGRLPPEQRQVVALRYLMEMTPGEIAGALDLPRGTVNSRLRRGLDALRDHVEER